MAKLPEDLEKGILNYRKSTPWYGQWPLVRLVIFAAIPLFIYMLAIALGVTVGEAIAILCTSGDMPEAFQWLCY